MPEEIFNLGYDQRTKLSLQIAEAVKSWRVSELEYDKILAQWHAETNLEQKEIFWAQVSLCGKIRDGDLAQVQLLADRYIREIG